ncbi:MAG TPA: hypothetical protein VIS72_12740 [Anaerolineales bacterium]
MSASERILIEILAQIQLRIMAKRQSELVNADSVNQKLPDEKSKGNEDHIMGNSDFLAKKEAETPD